MAGISQPNVTLKIGVTTVPPPLKHTLQTWQGMVCNMGKPQLRPCNIPWEEVEAKMDLATFPAILMVNLKALCGTPDKDNSEKVDSCLNLIAAYVRKNQMPIFSPRVPEYIRNMIHGNVFACTRQNVKAETLKSACKKRERFDIEQAAGIVVSFLGPQLGSDLIPHLSEIFFKSNMWLVENVIQHTRKSYDDILEDKWTRFSQKIDRIFKLQTPAITTVDVSPMELIRLLHRVRRNRPIDFTRMLRIPEEMYKRICVETPPNDPECSGWPVLAPPPNAIILSRHHFRIIENLIYRNRENSDASSILRREIDRLDKESLYGGANMASILCTNDPIALAFNFIVLQRRLQLKVVSDMGWSTFLKKGEGSKIWQNDWATLSSFEIKLFEMASAIGRKTDWECLLAVTAPPRFKHQVIDMSDRLKKHSFQIITLCCQLMEAYVNIHGNGDMGNLTYKRGSYDEPRGPVDQYNNLCDILFENKSALLSLSPNTHLQLPGRCQKFLAKDIMQWNDSWKDDAFADGKIPGWFDWLKNQRAIGHNCPPLFSPTV